MGKRWPSMAWVAIVAVAFMVWLPRPSIPLIDGDVWWHLRAGELVLATGAIPTMDPWTIVGEGMAWTSQDWLSNVLMAAAWRLGPIGPTILSIAFAGLVVLSLVLLWIAIGVRSPSSGWVARLTWLTVGLTVAGAVVGVRVQVVDLPLAAATLLVCWHFVVHRRRRVLLWLPVIAAAWANLHAGWVLLFLLGGAVLVGEATDRVLRRGTEPDPMPRRDLGWLAAGLAAAAAAISLNPNGPALFAYPLETASIAAHRDFLAEWSPPDPGTLPGLLFIGFVVIGVIPALALGWRRIRAADALILVGLTLMAASAARFLLVAPIAAAVVALVLGPVLARAGVTQGVARTLERMAAPPRSSAAAVVNAALIIVFAAVGFGITLARVAPAAQESAIEVHMPVAAVEWLIANDPGDRPFNTYSWGGYLGFMRPEELVYIDGRSDIYGDAPIRAYADAISLRSDPQALLEADRIDHVLFNTDHGFATWLDESPDWEVAYRDPQASVWVRTAAEE